MGRQEDDVATPIEHRHDHEGERFRHWRRTHPEGTWEGYQRDKQRRGSPKDLRPTDPLTPEQEQRAFRREHDTGDLDSSERALLEVGIAPRITLSRALARFGGVAGILLLLVSMVVGRTLSLLAAVAIGLVGLALFLRALFRPRPKKPRKQR